MRTMMKKATLAVALGASALVASAPAEAQRYNRWDRYDRYDRHRGNDGAAIVAGIAGIAIGAALTSGDRYDRRYDYDRRYYQQRGYYPNDGYYARNYYNQYDGWNRCTVRRVYDPYIGRTVRIRYC
ncbi:hypothetical protein M9980_10135 [Sphingomonas donggukensis]|uniref:17 kDa surface antigen n=1 Tax=Sphingomonas donggukensis TaxID=2949093 RepID=A0ABY4TRB0_9SPHN|nr:hypothetical protein [Sphingomonas donggukensis]URW74921.1 hypothetical protein M9980_10135 [Sphingomonas donggukensis]